MNWSGIKYSVVSRICAEECRTCARHCAETKGLEEIKRICEDCAEKCDKVVRSGMNDGYLLWECGVTSTICADLCSRINDPYLASCADACRKVEEECMALSIERLFSNSDYAFAQL